jgi:hypothetical protein
MKSGIGGRHYSHYLSERNRLDKLADKRRAKKKSLTKSEIDARLARAIFGRGKKKGR